MTNKTYDTIHFVSLIIAPTVAFIAAVVAIWQVPYAKEITATLTAFDAFVGAVVLVAKKLYEKNHGGGEDE